MPEPSQGPATPAGSDLPLRIGRRFAISFALSAVLLLLITGVSTVALRRAIRLERVEVEHDRDLIRLGGLRTAFEKKVAALSGYLLTGEPSYLEEISSARAQFRDDLARLRGDRGGGEQEGALLTLAEEKHQAALEKAIGLARAGQEAPAVTDFFAREVIPLRRQVDDRLAAFVNARVVRLEQAHRSEERQFWRSALLMLTIGAATLLLTLATSLILSRRLARHYEFERAERRRAADAEARKAAMLEAALDAIITIDHRGKVLEFNPAAERIFGYRREDAIGKELAQLIIPPAFRERHRAGLAEYLVTGKGPVLGKRIEMPALRADGTEFPAELSISRLPGEDLPVFTGSLRDITERQRAESERNRLLGLEREARAEAEASERLAQQERAAVAAAARRSSFLAEASAVLASSLDYNETLKSVARLAVASTADWCVVELANRAGVLEQIEVAHADPSRVALARELNERYPRDPDSPYGSSHVFRTGKAELSSEIPDELLREVASDEEHYRLLRGLGPVSYMCVPLRARDEVLGTMTFVSAESGRRYGPEDLALAEALAHRASLAVDNARLYAGAQEAIRIREEFLSIASHELKTPVTTLQLQVQSLLRRALPELKASPASQWMGARLSTVERQIERLAKLIDNLLDVSRLAAGRVPVRREEVDLARIVRDVVSRSREDLMHAGCSVLMRGGGSSVGEWDALRLDQVMTNLLSNAMKYGAGRPITITLDGNEKTARLTVEDQGIGISRADQERIFERFERAVSERHYGGLGLGLFIVRQIVEALGGAIRVASEPGRGAAFTVELPRRRG